MGNPSTIIMSGFVGINGKVKSGNALIPPQYKMTAGNFYDPPLFPMRKMYPMEDAVTPTDAHHRNSRAGVPWECPVRVMYGGVDRCATISGLPGATIGNFYGVDAYGNLQPDANYLNIFWANPVPGTYNITVTVWDQISSVTFRWTHVCGVMWLFGAPEGAGLADGSSPADPMAWSNVYLGYNVIGPSKGKTLCLLNGFYPAPEYNCDPAFNSRNVVSMHGQTAAFSCKFNDKSSDRFLGGLEFRDVAIAGGGLVATEGVYHRVTDFKLRFINITKSGGANNQSCRFTSGWDGQFRKNIVTTQCYYDNCLLMANESYSIETQLIDRAVVNYSNSAITTLAAHPIWLPKGGIKNCEMSWLRFDNPTVNGSTEGIIKPYGGATHYGGTFADQVCTHLVQNCFVRCNGGAAIISMSASNGAAYPVIANAYLLRNTVIGGAVESYGSAFGASDPNSSRASLYDRNVIQNPAGGLKIGGGTGGYTVTNSECHGVSGIVDSNGNLTAGYSAYLAKRGVQVRK